MQTTCAHCGALNPAGKVFCGACGKAAALPPAPAQTAPIPPSLPPSPASAPPMRATSPPVPSPWPVPPAPSPGSGYSNPPGITPSPLVGRAAGASGPVGGQLFMAGTARGVGLGISRKTWLSGLAGAVAGLIAGLISLPVQLTGLGVTDPFTAGLTLDFVVIGSAGLLIGAALGALDGFMAGQWRLLGRGLLRGAGVGLLASVIILVLAEVVFHGMNATEFARQLAWVLFGVPFGAVEGFRRQTPLRLVLGMIGGGLGGAIGGMLANMNCCASLLVLGFMIGFFIGLLHDLFKQAWLRVLTGRSEGREVVLDQPRTVVGSGDIGQVDFGLYGDPAIIRQHAEITRQSGGYQLVPLVAAAVLINGTAINGPTPLHNEDRVQLGNTTLVFCNRRA